MVEVLRHKITTGQASSCLSAESTPSVHVSSLLNAQNDYQQCFAYNLQLRDALKNAVDALSAHDVPVIVYKGQDYLDRVYGDLGARPMSDADVLVPKSAIRLTTKVLKDRGFSVGKTSRRANHEMPFCRFDMAIDVHTSMVQPLRDHVDYEEVFARRIPFRSIPGASLFEPTDAFLMHVFCQAGEAYQIPYSSIHELAFLFRGVERTLLLDRAQRWQLLFPLYCSLRLLSEHGVESATELLSEIKLPSWRRSLLERLIVAPSLGKKQRSRTNALLCKLLLTQKTKDAVLSTLWWLSKTGTLVNSSG